MWSRQGHKSIYLFIFVLLISFSSAVLVENPDLPLVKNAPTLVFSNNNTFFSNNTWFWQGYIPTTLPHNVLANLAWSVAGHIMDTDLDMDGNSIVTGNITADYFYGNGSQLADINASRWADNFYNSSTQDIWQRIGTVLSPKTAGDDITTTGTGTFGSTYQATLGDDANSRAGHFYDGTRTIDIATGTYSLDVNIGPSGGYGAYYHDISNNYVVIMDANNCMGNFYYSSYSTGARLATSSAGGYFSRGPYYIQLADSSYSAYANGEIYAYKFTDSGGGYDPYYVQYDTRTREQIVEIIRLNVPPEKQSGATLFFNVDTKKMETYIASEGKFYDMNGNQVHALAKPVVGKSFETLYHLDRMTGKVVSHQRATEPLYNIKADYQLDKNTGKIYDKDKKEVSKEEAIEK